MKLMIVESAGKIPTLKKILGSDWKILATAGHIRELSDDNYGYGFNFTDFQPSFKYIDGKKKMMDTINQQANFVDEIFIAGDPDREGEAISYHVYSLLNKDCKNKSKRITFNELTNQEVTNAINHPRKLDDNLVNAQFARVVLDKLFGYQASEAIRRSGSGSSAGRVQSVALLLINQRDEEIKNFQQSFWYEINANLKNNNHQDIVFKTTLKAINDETKKLEPMRFATTNEANSFIKTNLKSEYLLKDISKPYQKQTKAPDPFITSAVLKLADKLKIKTKEIQKILQVFYENGICTYPRTDSITMRPEFCETVKAYIEKHYGSRYYNPLLLFNSKKQKDSVQEGHDAIRPVDIEITENDLDSFEKYLNAIGYLQSKAKELYAIIRNRTIASCMQPKINEIIDLVFDNNNYLFYSKISSVKFDGFSIIEQNETNKINDETQTIDLTNINLKVNDVYYCCDLDNMVQQKKTTPPPLFTQASLIATLEKKEIGRPSTYVNMVQINIDRGYVDLLKDNKMQINEKGKQVIEFVKAFFSDVINEQYTKDMEKALDLIANGKMQWVDDFIKPFYEDLKIALANFNLKIQENIVKNNQFKKPILKVCPDCNQVTVVKILNNNKAIEECSTNKYDFKTKKTNGCGWKQWLS